MAVSRHARPWGAALLTVSAVFLSLAFMVARAPAGAAAGPAASPTPDATATTYTLSLHQDPPIQNSGFGEKGDCPGSPAQWGWHFVVTGGEAQFVSLTTTFENAGTITTTVFGPPDAKHAYVYTATDDTLLSASATVTGGDPDKVLLNLSHTCAGTVATPTPTLSPSESPTPTPSVSESPSPSASVSESPSPSATVSATAIVVGPSDTPTPVVSGVKLVKPPAKQPPAVQGERLPRTGAPVALLLLVGVGTLAAGVGTTYGARTRYVPLHRA